MTAAFRLCFLFRCFSPPWSRAVQQFWTTLHQLHQRKAPTILQSSHVYPRTRGIQTRRNRVDVYWLRNGSPADNRSDREGTVKPWHELSEMNDRRLLRLDRIAAKRVSGLWVQWWTMFRNRRTSSACKELPAAPIYRSIWTKLLSHVLHRIGVVVAFCSLSAQTCP